MKNFFFATTVLASVSLASGAFASGSHGHGNGHDHGHESGMMSAMGNNVTVGGFYSFGYATLSDDYKGTASTEADSVTYGESELFIDFENHADNGLIYGVQIDLVIIDGEDGHADGGGESGTKEASIYLEGDFGTIVLGHNDNAFSSFQTKAPTGEGTFSQHMPHVLAGGNYAAFLHDMPVTHRHGTSLAETPAFIAGEDVEDDNNAKVAYFSPSFNGFSFGASTRDSDTESDNPASFGASFETGVGPGTLIVTGATYSNNADGEDKLSATTYGITYAMDAVTFTASRGKADIGDHLAGEDSHAQGGMTMTGHAHEHSFNFGGGEGDATREVTEFGIGFEVGDGIWIGFSHATSESNRGAAVAAGSIPVKHEGTFTSLSGDYEIAEGLGVFAAMNQFEVEDVGHPEHKNDGSVFVVGVEFVF